METHVIEVEKKLLLTKCKSKEKIENILSMANEKGKIVKLEKHPTSLHKKDALIENQRKLHKEEDLTQITIETKDKDAVIETTLDSLKVRTRDFVLGTSIVTKSKRKKRRGDFS